MFLFGETFFHGELSKNRPLIQEQGQIIELKGWQVFLGGKEWNDNRIETADGMMLALVAHNQLLVYTIPLLKSPITLANSEGATFRIKGNAFGVIEPILDGKKNVQDYELFLSANNEVCYLNGEKVEEAPESFGLLRKNK